jgi:hypothetical protein
MTFKPGQIFPRSFRWILKSTNHPEIHWWITRLKTDYLNQIIILDCYDDINGVIFDWLQATITNGAKESLQISHLNNMGDTMYLVNFKNLQMLEHTTTYDYKSQGILTHTVKIKYEMVERCNKLNNN